MTQPDQTRVVRPWGWYQVLHRGSGLQVKQLSVAPGQRLSYQRHGWRAEHWYVVSGVGGVRLDGVDLDVVAGAGVDVPVGAAHRLANTGVADLVVVEVQTGAYLDEDDIERLADDYGRCHAGAAS